MTAGQIQVRLHCDISHLPPPLVFLLLSAIVDADDVKEEVGTLEHLLQ